jgi:hypothetical protein
MAARKVEDAFDRRHVRRFERIADAAYRRQAHVKVVPRVAGAHRIVRRYPRIDLLEKLAIGLVERRIEPLNDRGRNDAKALRKGGYRLYSRKKNPKSGKRRNLGTFKTRAAAEKHERAVPYFKH